MEIGVKYGARPELIAELVVRCLETGVEFNSWHYLLERDSCSGHVNAVIELVKRESSLYGRVCYGNIATY